MAYYCVAITRKAIIQSLAQSYRLIIIQIQIKKLIFALLGEGKREASNNCMCMRQNLHVFSVVYLIMY